MTTMMVKNLASHWTKNRSCRCGLGSIHSHGRATAAPRRTLCAHRRWFLHGRMSSRLHDFTCNVGLLRAQRLCLHGFVHIDVFFFFLCVAHIDVFFFPCSSSFPIILSLGASQPSESGSTQKGCAQIVASFSGTVSVAMAMIKLMSGDVHLVWNKQTRKMPDVCCNSVACHF